LPNVSSTLCLVTRAKPTKGLAGLRAKFEDAGYALVPAPLASVHALTTEWIASYCIGATKGLVFIDESVEYVQSVIDHLIERSSAARFLPVFYVFTSPDLIGEWEDVHGVSDFIPATDPAHGLELRLTLRIREAADRAAIVRMAQEQSSQIAKIDTALKQREEFLGVCAHDLRSPLALIQTCLSMVMKSREASALQPMHNELLARAHRQSAYAITLVKDLLDVTALEQGLKPHYQVLKLHDLLAAFFNDYTLQAQQKNVKFHYNNPVQDWRVLADSERIQQLLQNLFTNALKFTEAGKNIFLSVAPFQGRRKGDPSYPMVVISLKDEGRGIPQKELEKIFDRFVQIKEHSRQGGRGLGLTVAKQISTLHDGNIWVESEEGHGSTFFVLFPHTLGQLEPKVLAAKPKRILVAEASEQKRKDIFGKLTEWGYEVQFAKDGVEAMTFFYHHSPDALVLSPDLAKIATPDVANLLKGDPATQGIPVLLATANTSTNPQKFDSILADGNLPTPFTREQWEQVLGSLIAGAKKAA
jgi:signal transduction histidine kinase